MIYDRADWHYQGDYPEDLPPQNGGTHIGFFFTWLLNNKLLSEQLMRACSEEFDAIRGRQLGGREFIAQQRDGQLADSDLSKTGNAFALYYYDSDLYFNDYVATLVGSRASLYHVDDTWENYDLMAAVIDERFAEWDRTVRAKWWKFW